MKDMWRRGNVVGALFLDIKGAFPSVILERLIHNMRCRGVPKEYTDWIYEKVKGRITTIVFDDFVSAAEEILHGLDQGCPLSGVTFHFYNTDLLDVTKTDEGEDSVGVVDNATMLVERVDPTDIADKMTEVLQREEGAGDWSDIHECLYALDKFGWMILTRRCKEALNGPKRTRLIRMPAINIKDKSIKPKETHKFLGVMMDQELWFNNHITYTYKKGTKFIEQYWCLAKTTKGISTKFMSYYLAVAVLKMLYAADLFIIPPSCHQQGSKGIINKLARIQGQATLAATGAFSTTASNILNAHADLLPFPLLVSKQIH
jgi:hypothetical protein